MAGRTASQALAVLLAGVPMVTGAFVLLLTFLLGGLQCDESCTGEDWRHTAGAWQWSLYPALGAIVCLAGIVTFVFVARRRPGAALAALALGTVVFFSGLVWSGENWDVSLARHPLLVGLIACIVISGVVAALLSAPTGQDLGSDPEGGLTPAVRLKARTG